MSRLREFLSFIIFLIHPIIVLNILDRRPELGLVPILLNSLCDVGNMILNED